MCSNRKQKPNESNKPLKQIKKNNNNDNKKTHSIENLANNVQLSYKRTQINSIYLIMVLIIGNELKSKQWYLLYKELQQE